MKLPSEILELILNQIAHKPTLFSIMQVSSTFHSLTIPILYQSITINSINLLLKITRLKTTRKMVRQHCRSLSSSSTIVCFNEYQKSLIDGLLKAKTDRGVLQIIDLSGNTFLRSKQLKPLANHIHLTHLNLSQTRLTSTVLIEILSKTHKLNSLNISHCQELDSLELAFTALNPISLISLNCSALNVVDLPLAIKILLDKCSSTIEYLNLNLNSNVAIACFDKPLVSLKGIEF